MVGVRIKVMVTWMGVFDHFFHNPVLELQKSRRKGVILELGVWPISKTPIGPLA